MGYGNFRGGGSSGGSRGFGGGSRGGFGGNRGGFRRSFGPREMTKIKCSKCGKEDEVPFKPREGTPVYCKECYFKEKGITPRSGNFGPVEGKKKEAVEGEEFAEETEPTEGEAKDSEDF